MNPVLERWNLIADLAAGEEILSCGGSRAWAAKMAARRPVVNEIDLFAASDAAWQESAEAGWQEAFDSHPRLGQREAKATETSLRWSGEEQHAMSSSDLGARRALEGANRQYEERFGRVFILCANGKPAEDILQELERRMKNSPEREIEEAREQQRQITRLRLERWLKEARR